jgi:formamidopyrimidine-DNA glycosylase
MPELPEVESISVVLRQGKPGQPALVGKTIQGAQLFWERTLAQPAQAEFLQRLPGQLVRDVYRRGKFLVIVLSVDYLLIHLRMSGDIFILSQAEPLPAHTRLALFFKDGTRLAFNDARKFGRLWLVSNPEAVTAGLGPEPLEESLDAITFFNRLHARRRQLKPLLMDQSFMAGLGNIYTDEALHLAKLHPLVLSDHLSMEQSERLLESIRTVLREGIQRNGTSIDWVYRGGEHQAFLRVYGRTAEPCPICGTPIARLVVGQRGTHFCPICQPAPKI